MECYTRWILEPSTEGGRTLPGWVVSAGFRLTNLPDVFHYLESIKWANILGSMTGILHCAIDIMSRTASSPFVESANDPRYHTAYNTSTDLYSLVFPSLPSSHVSDMAASFEVEQIVPL